MFGLNFLRKNKQQIISINEFGRIFDGFYKQDSEKFLNELYDNPFTSSAITRINEAINNLMWSTYKKGHNDNITEVKDSYVNRTIRSPSKILNTDQLINYFALYYIIYGELVYEVRNCSFKKRNVYS